MGCYNSAVIPAPVDKLWSALRNFHDLSWAEGVVETVEVIGDAAPDQIGAGRLINGAFRETLLALDDNARALKYSIDDGPGPASKDNVGGYVGDVRLHAISEDDTTLVVWTSSWSSGGDGVAELCNPIYRALLATLKARFS